MDLRNKDKLSIRPESLGPPPLNVNDEHYCDTFVNDSIMDQMIFNLNGHHFKDQLIAERCNHTSLNDSTVGSVSVGKRYVL
jgi:hypothetical protein